MKLSASRLHLAALCAAAFALPSAEDTESTEAQAAGTGRHRYLSDLAEAFAAGDPDPTATALAKVPADAPWRSTCMGIDTGDLLPGVVTIRHDVAYAYDTRTDTARELEVLGHRQYGTVNPTEITGTLDWRTTDTNGNVTVIDFKGTGRTTPAARNLQLALYALCVARVEGLDEVNVALCYIGEDGALTWDRASWDRWDLAALAERIATVWQWVSDARAAVAQGQVPDTYPGLHCTRCPALRLCPAHISLARAFSGSAPLLDASQTVQLSDLEAGEAWVTVARLQALLDAVRDSLRARVRSHPIPLPDGTQVVAVDSTRRSLDVVRALPVLQARVGERVDTYVDRSLPTGVVTRLAREMAPGLGLTIKNAAKVLWGELEAAGAVRATTVVSCQVRAAKDGSA